MASWVRWFIILVQKLFPEEKNTKRPYLHTGLCEAVKLLVARDDNRTLPHWSNNFYFHPANTISAIARADEMIAQAWARSCCAYGQKPSEAGNETQKNTFQTTYHILRVYTPSERAYCLARDLVCRFFILCARGEQQKHKRIPHAHGMPRHARIHMIALIIRARQVNVHLRARAWRARPLGTRARNHR